VAAQKADPDAVADFPFGDAVADGVDGADDFVPGHHRPAGIGTHALGGDKVGVADTAGLDAKPHMTGIWFEQLAFHQFELALTRDLKSAICRHVDPP
jgi:hypothetical protein